MEMLNISNKDNLINNYGITPTLPYDIEGELVEKNGKDIKVQKTIDNKTVEYSLRLKQEIVGELGDNISIEKENIVSIRVEEKEEKEIVKDETEVRKVADILMELGLEYTEENIRMIEFLLKNGIMITKGNVDSYMKSKEYLNKIIEGIDVESYVKLMDRGIDLEEANLQKIAQELEEIKNEKMPFSIKRFLRIEKDLTYKEAEEIAKEIYGQKMGKDVYDTIIALHKENLPITRENIDRTLEVMSKLHNLKKIKDEAYVKILNENRPFNIENLYKLNNSYTKTALENNATAKGFEFFTIEKETTIDSLREVLANLDITDTPENINILREFIVNDMVMEKDNYNKIISMKESVRELTDLLGYVEVSELNKQDIDPLQEDIHKLVEKLKNDRFPKEINEPLNDEKIREIKNGLEILGNIKDNDLLQLIKNGEDFTIKAIKEIIDTSIQNDLSLEYKTLNKVIHLTGIFNTLGDIINIDTVSLTAKRHGIITLNNLYVTQKETSTSQEAILPVDKISEGLIYEEYINARNNLTTNMVKESIKEGKILEHMELNELNNYIVKKINRYKEGSRITKEIGDIEGKSERILPLIMKNGLSMTLKEIKDINSLLNGEKSLSNILKDILDPRSTDYNKEQKESIKLLQEKISTSFKNGDDMKESYKELMNTLSSSNNSFNSNKRKRAKEEYIEIINKISQKDIILQFPIQIDDEYKSLNLIIPDINKGIDKNNMSFFISLSTENLGPINIGINVKGKDIQINIEERGTSLNNNIFVLEESLAKLGYRMTKDNRSMSL